jgi:hypothetical protein
LLLISPPLAPARLVGLLLPIIASGSSSAFLLPSPPRFIHRQALQRRFFLRILTNIPHPTNEQAVLIEPPADVL